jgi:hypothetical protein
MMIFSFGASAVIDNLLRNLSLILSRIKTLFTLYLVNPFEISSISLISLSNANYKIKISNI